MFSKAQNFGADFEKLNQRMLKGEDISNTQFEKLLTSYPKQIENYPEESAKLYYYMGGNFNYDKKIDKAAESYNYAYSYSLRAKDTTLKYIIMLSYGRLRFNEEKYDKAEEYYLFSLPGMAAYYGPSSIEYTNIYYEYVKLLMNMERIKEAKPLLAALEYYFKTLNLITNETYLGILADQAYILQEEDNFNPAIEKYKFILENTKLLKRQDTLRYITILSNLGEAYREKGDDELAISSLLSAKRFMKKNKVKQPQQLASIENFLGLFYKALNDYSNAEENFNDAITIYKEEKLENSEAYCTV